jgi:hypothetical protein
MTCGRCEGTSAAAGDGSRIGSTELNKERASRDRRGITGRLRGKDMRQRCGCPLVTSLQHWKQKAGGYLPLEVEHRGTRINVPVFDGVSVQLLGPVALMSASGHVVRNEGVNPRALLALHAVRSTRVATAVMPFPNRRSPSVKGVGCPGGSGVAEVALRFFRLLGSHRQPTRCPTKSVLRCAPRSAPMLSIASVSGESTSPGSRGADQAAPARRSSPEPRASRPASSKPSNTQHGSPAASKASSSSPSPFS